MFRFASCRHRVDEHIARQGRLKSPVEDVDLEGCPFGEVRREVGVADGPFDRWPVGDAPEATDDLAIEADGLAAVDRLVVGAADDEGSEAASRTRGVAATSASRPTNGPLSSRTKRRVPPRTGSRASSGRCRSSGSPSPGAGRRGRDSRTARGRAPRPRRAADPRPHRPLDGRRQLPAELAGVADPGRIDRGRPDADRARPAHRDRVVADVIGRAPAPTRTSRARGPHSPIVARSPLTSRIETASSSAAWVRSQASSEAT